MPVCDHVSCNHVVSAPGVCGKRLCPRNVAARSHQGAKMGSGTERALASADPFGCGAEVSTFEMVQSEFVASGGQVVERPHIPGRDLFRFKHPDETVMRETKRQIASMGDDMTLQGPVWGAGAEAWIMNVSVQRQSLSDV